MKRARWRTGPPIKYQQPIAPMTGGQLLRQLLVMALLLLIWGGGFFVFLKAAQPSGAGVLVEALTTTTPVPVPTNTSIPAATRTAAPRATLTVAATGEPLATMPSTTEPTATSRASTLPTVNAAAVSYQRDVQPIFDQICVKCHGGEDVKEGLSLKTYAEAMQGSDNGAVIVPGDPVNSLLVQQVENGKMPKRGPKLLPKQIQTIVAWVAAGAPDN